MSHGVLKPHGLIEIDGHQVADTIQCAHCGRHFLARPIKAGGVFNAKEAEAMEKDGQRMRGYCARCDGPLCGPKCAACIPWQRKLDNALAGKPLDYAPTVVSVPRSIHG